MNSRFVLIVVLGFCSAVSTQGVWRQECAKLWNNPRDFFMYKESKAYCKAVRENGLNMSLQWRDFKGFVKTPTGKVFIAYELAATAVQGYLGYKAYQYAAPDNKQNLKLDNTQVNS